MALSPSFQAFNCCSRSFGIVARRYCTTNENLTVALDPLLLRQRSQHAMGAQGKSKERTWLSDEWCRRTVSKVPTIGSHVVGTHCYVPRAVMQSMHTRHVLNTLCLQLLLSADWLWYAYFYLSICLRVNSNLPLPACFATSMAMLCEARLWGRKAALLSPAPPPKPQVGLLYSFDLSRPRLCIRTRHNLQLRHGGCPSDRDRWFLGLRRDHHAR